MIEYIRQDACSVLTQLFIRYSVTKGSLRGSQASVRLIGLACKYECMLCLLEEFFVA